MTTFTGDVNIRTLDSSVTAINLQRGGGATFTGPVTFASSVSPSGLVTLPVGTTAAGIVFTGASAGGMIATTAANPQLVGAAPSNGGRLGCRGVFSVVVDGTVAYIPFFYASATL